jgi:hypothetical protein
LKGLSYERYLAHLKKFHNHGNGKTPAQVQREAERARKEYTLLHFPPPPPRPPKKKTKEKTTKQRARRRRRKIEQDKVNVRELVNFVIFGSQVAKTKEDKRQGNRRWRKKNKARNNTTNKRNK